MASAIPPSLPASPRRRRPPSPSSSVTASSSTATPRAASRSGWRPRTADAASSMSRATARGRRSCARWSLRCAPRPRSPSSRGWRRAACWSTIAASPACWRRGRGAPACCRPVASCSPPAGWAGSTPTRPIRWAPSARAWRWPPAPARRSATWSSCSSIRRRSPSGSIPCRWSAKRCAARAPCWWMKPASGSWRGRAAPSSSRATSSRAPWPLTSPPATASSSMRAGRWARTSRPTSPASPRAAGPPASIRRSSRSRCGRRRTTTWAASPWMARAAARSKACGRAARRRRPACTAPIVWPAIPCSRRW